MAVYAGKLVFQFMKDSDILKQILVSLAVSVFFLIQLYHSYYQAKPSNWVYSKSSEEEYLKINVSKNIWSFYDYSGDVAEIVGDSKVLVYNVHNLFHIDFVYEDASFIKSAVSEMDNPEAYLISEFDYLFLKRSEPNSLYSEIGVSPLDLKLVYEDSIAEVKLYEVIK